jgi:small conductance mechanosensitive channel
MILLSLAQDSAAALTQGGGDLFTQIGYLLDVDGPWLLRQLLRGAIIILLAVIGLRIAKGLMRRVQGHIEEEERESPGEDTQRAKTVAQLAFGVARVVIWITATLLVLNLFFPIGPLLAGVGVFGLALSFGAQSLVKDMISGFFILLENQFAIGDIIEVNGTSGVVERMTLRIVAVRDVEGVLHVIPNGTITEVSNKTKEWARVVLDVGIGYPERVDSVIEVLKEISKELAEDQTWAPQLTEGPNVLGVQELSDSAVNIRVVATTRPGRQWDVKRELRRRIKNRFDVEGIEIPFPQRTVHFKGSPATGPSA